MRAAIIAGSGRSGTTWVAELLAAMEPARIVFEPFHGRVPIGKLFAFRYFRPGDECEPLRIFWDVCLKGKVGHRWVSHLQQGEPAPGPFAIVKAIRANLMLAWVRSLHPTLRILYLIRDPRAVVASRIRCGWASGGPLKSMLEQPTLLGDHLTPALLDLARSVDGEVAGHAVQWSIENRVVLAQAKAADIRILRYEDLVRGPQHGLGAIQEAADTGHWPNALPLFDRPSKTAFDGDGQRQSTMARLERWKVDLCSKDIVSIGRIVRAFGLGAYLREDS
jgi:hypothetical protein